MTHFGITLVALASLITTVVVLRYMHVAIPDCVLVLMASVIVPLILLDVWVLRVHRRASTGLDWDKTFAPDIGRVATKMLGLAATVGLIALAYWAFPEYAGTFYSPFYGVLRRFWIALTVGAHFLHLARRRVHEGSPRRVLAARTRGARSPLRRAPRRHGQALPRLAREGVLLSADVRVAERQRARHGPHRLALGGLGQPAPLRLPQHAFIYGVDLLCTLSADIMSFRIFDTHLRSTEPTVYGWAVALFCYPPFYNGLMERQFVHYGSGYDYESWLAPWPQLRWAWAVVILLLVAFYTMSSVVFGLRFSNLTHRGILTNGTYRYTKHPAYVSKNLSWWLVSVPFLPHEADGPRPHATPSSSDA